MYDKMPHPHYCKQIKISIFSDSRPEVYAEFGVHFKSTQCCHHHHPFTTNGPTCTFWVIYFHYCFFQKITARAWAPSAPMGGAAAGSANAWIRACRLVIQIENPTRSVTVTIKPITAPHRSLRRWAIQLVCHALFVHFDPPPGIQTVTLCWECILCASCHN